MANDFVLGPAAPDDAEWMAELKADAMRADLERLGYWNRDWARRRFLETYVPANTTVIETADGVAVFRTRARRDLPW